MSELRRFYWLKLKDDFFRDKRIKKLRKIAGGDTYTIIYLKLQLESLKNNGVLIYEGIEQSFAEEIALEIDEDVDNVKVTLAFLIENDLIIESDNNKFELPETQELIGTETSWAIQKRKQRLKNKTLGGQCPRDIDIDIDIDKKEEIYKEEKKLTKVTNFVKPSLDDVTNYCKERNNNVNPQAFVDFYESKGWMIGKNKMKDWKAAVRTWERFGKSNSNKKVVETPNWYNEFYKEDKTIENKKVDKDEKLIDLEEFFRKREENDN